MTRQAYILILSLAALTTSGCARRIAGAPTQKPAAFGSAVVESSGGKQIAAVGTTLAQPVVVQVNDDQGTGVVGALVQMSGPAGVQFEPGTGLTDSSGQFTTSVSVGGMAGRYQITAATLNKAQKKSSSSWKKSLLDTNRFSANRLITSTAIAATIPNRPQSGCPITTIWKSSHTRLPKARRLTSSTTPTC